MEEVLRYRRCFVCGEENAHGLKARFFYDGEQAVSEVVASESFEGYRGIYHGGIISTLLDEVMIKALLAEGLYTVTAEMTVRFHKPVEIGQTIRFIGKKESSKGRVFLTSGRAEGPDQTVFATATGKYVQARSDLAGKLAESVEPE